MPRALIVGGTGAIGRAAARRLLTAGWQVDLTGRHPARLPADVAAVYVDGAGHHSNSATAPRFDGPIRETQPTVAPGDADYTTREGTPRTRSRPSGFCSTAVCP